MHILLALVVLAALTAGALLWFTKPAQVAALPEHEPDLANGELLFHAGGCASCHAEAKSEGEARFLLGGGLRLETPFGTFVAPNISPHTEHGIGNWSDADFASAMLLGTSPQGEHYYPAFPYASYARMTVTDVIDLKRFIDTLPIVERANEPHELGFPFNIRLSLGFWKALNLDPQPVIEVDDSDPVVMRGRYLVEGPGHCAECHTPRDPMGGLDSSRWMAGAPNPEGKGRIPNITPDGDGLGDWSHRDVIEVITSGFTPEYDVVGGTMTEVVKNMSQLPDSDRDAIATYLAQIPPLPDAP